MKAFGQLNSRFRSHDQTNLGAWWLEFNERQWGRIMRHLTDTRQLSLLDAARMFALGHMAIIDATVAVWYAKNYYDFWRPFHAIGLADTDGNRFTEADPNWVGERIVPPLQVKHRGRVRLPPEVDVQNDPAIHSRFHSLANLRR